MNTNQTEHRSHLITGIIIASSTLIVALIVIFSVLLAHNDRSCCAPNPYIYDDEKVDYKPEPIIPTTPDIPVNDVPDVTEDVTTPKNYVDMAVNCDDLQQALDRSELGIEWPGMVVRCVDPITNEPVKTVTGVSTSPINPNYYRITQGIVPADSEVGGAAGLFYKIGKTGQWQFAFGMQAPVGCDDKEFTNKDVQIAFSDNICFPEYGSTTPTTIQEYYKLQN